MEWSRIVECSVEFVNTSRNGATLLDRTHEACSTKHGTQRQGSTQRSSLGTVQVKRRQIERVKTRDEMDRMGWDGWMDGPWRLDGVA
jgi:hypothetical protein